MKNWLVKQFGYYANGLLSITDNQFDTLQKENALPKFIIVAKRHYTESWQTFPSVNRKELDKILQLKEAGKSESVTKHQVVPNDKVDGFDVKTIFIDNDVISVLGKDKVFIPESDLLMMEKTGVLLQLETPAGLLFCTNISGVVKSSYAQGIVANIETYKLSVGLPTDVTSVSISNNEYAKYLSEVLFTVPTTKLYQLALFNVKDWFNWSKLHWLYWAPLATALIFYAVTDSYYYYKNTTLTNSLSAGGTEVNEILQQKRTLDIRQREIAALSAEFSEQIFIHNHWQVVDVLIEAGMTITKTSYKAPVITIRGTADKASDVLAAISKYEYVKRAAFQGAVRKSRGKDSFILTIEVKDM